MKYLPFQYQVKTILIGYMKLSQTTEKNKEKEINSDKELIELKKTIFDEAVNVRLDYEENPNEDSTKEKSALRYVK